MDLSARALEAWNPCIVHAASGENGIDILDVIGEDFFGGGITAKRISAALGAIGAEKPITVNINSPGGDMFEGLAIYNLLRAHQGEVTVKILGLAASAASVIAMAGDKVEIAKSGFLMIHNAWILAMGNRHDLTEIAAILEPFDRAMGGIYETRTGMDSATIEKMMDRETWIGGADAIDQGFADDYLPADQIAENAKSQTAKIAARKLDLALAKAGLPRSERRGLLNEFKSGMHDAAGTGTPSAVAGGKQNATAYQTDESAVKISTNLRGEWLWK